MRKWLIEEEQCTIKAALAHAALWNDGNMPFGVFHGKQVSLCLDRGCVHLACHMTGKECHVFHSVSVLFYTLVTHSALIVKMLF